MHSSLLHARLIPAIARPLTQILHKIVLLHITHPQQAIALTLCSQLLHLLDELHNALIALGQLYLERRYARLERERVFSQRIRRLCLLYTSPSPRD